MDIKTNEAHRSTENLTHIYKAQRVLKQTNERAVSVGLTRLYPRLKSASPGQYDTLLWVWFAAELLLNAISGERAYFTSRKQLLYKKTLEFNTPLCSVCSPGLCNV
jgi:hypothetical protein